MSDRDFLIHFTKRDIANVYKRYFKHFKQKIVQKKFFFIILNININSDDGFNV